MPVLDLVGGAVAAYSFRKLSGSYAGVAVNVRRGSDNRSQDIGFTRGGNFDTAAFLAFIGGGSGFVTKLYDQSGNGLDVSQATAANQPQLQIVGSRPCIVFDGVGGHNLASANDARSYPGITVATVAKESGSFGTILGASDPGFTVGWLWGFNNGGAPQILRLLNQPFNIGVQTNAVSAEGDGGFHADIVRVSASVGDILEDGNSLALGSSSLGSVTTTTGQPVVLGDDLASGDVPFTGSLREAVVWASAVTVLQRDTVHNDQRAYWLSSVGGVRRQKRQTPRQWFTLPNGTRVHTTPDHHKALLREFARSEARTNAQIALARALAAAEREAQPITAKAPAPLAQRVLPAQETKAPRPVPQNKFRAEIIAKREQKLALIEELRRRAAEATRPAPRMRLIFRKPDPRRVIQRGVR